MRSIVLLLALLCAACATPPPSPLSIPHEAEAAPPHIMSAVRDVAPDIAVHNVSVDGGVFLIEGTLADGDAITLHVAQLGERWKVVDFHRGPPPTN